MDDKQGIQDKKVLSTRQRIFEIIEPAHNDERFSKAYDVFQVCVIILSLVPLVFKETTQPMVILEYIATAIFLVDYVLRWLTADFRFGETGAKPFLRYPFSFMAIIDILSILPTFALLNESARVFRVVRLLRIVRVFKIFRYSNTTRMISKVLRESRRALLAVGGLAVVYILISALIVFNVEPETFDNFFEAIYWATVSLTTVGYGDFYPHTTIGQAITMISSIFGIAVVALPAGIITAGYMTALDERRKDELQELQDLRDIHVALTDANQSDASLEEAVQAVQDAWDTRDSNMDGYWDWD